LFAKRLLPGWPVWATIVEQRPNTDIRWMVVDTYVRTSQVGLAPRYVGAEAKSGRAGVRGRVPRLVQQSLALRAKRDAALAVAICGALRQPGLLQRQQP